MKKIILFAFLLGNVALYGQSTVSTINKGYKLNAGQYLDTRMGSILAGKSVPYSGVSAANAAIFPSFRCVGMTVLIDTLGSLKEYWYLAGISNGNLVEKIGGSNVTFADSLEMAKSFKVLMYGDSFTEGTFPVALQQLFGYYTYNRGIGGETSTQIKARFLQYRKDYPYTTIIWAGRNNYSDTVQVEADIAQMVDSLPHNRYVVISILNQSTEPIGSNPYNIITRLNARLAATYGANFFDARAVLLTMGNSFGQDVTDRANGVIPTSLRRDNLHLNDTGNIVLSNQLIYAKQSVLFPENKAVSVNDYVLANSRGSVKVGTLLNVLGETTGGQLTTGIWNTAMGTNALSYETNGSNNTAIGLSALRSQKGVDNNTAVGANAGGGITTGYSNTLVGSIAGESITTGYDNVGIGALTLRSASTGFRNMALGRASLYSLTTGVQNTAIGGDAGFNLTTGYNNFFGGYNTGIGITTGSSNTFLGANMTGIPSYASNRVYISDGDGTYRLRFDSIGRFYLPSYMAISSIPLDSAMVLNRATGLVEHRPLPTASSLWSLSGNSAITPVNNFIGTIDGRSFRTRTNNIERMIVDSSGLVGIGTSIPQSKLSVTGGDIDLMEESNGRKIGFNATNNFISGSGVSTAYYGMTFGSQGGSSVGISGFGSLAMYTNGSERMRINASGRIGIGTSNPDSTLHIIGSLKVSGLLRQNEANDSMLVVNSSGGIGYRAIPSGGGSGTFNGLINDSTGLGWRYIAPNTTNWTDSTLTSRLYNDGRYWQRADTSTQLLSRARARATYALSGQVALTDGATITWNALSGARAFVTLAGNRTLTITNAIDGDYGELLVTQDATGSRTLSVDCFRPDNGIALALSTGAGKRDLIAWRMINGQFYFNIVAKDFACP